MGIDSGTQLERGRDGAVAVPVWFRVDKRAVSTALFGTILVLVLLDTLLNLAEFRFGQDALLGLVQLFDLNRERNFPTWFASVQLALAALLLADGARSSRARGDRHVKAWVAPVVKAGPALRQLIAAVLGGMRPLLERVRRGEIDPSFVITHRPKLDQAPDGYDMFLNKEDDCIKVVLTP